MGERVLSMAEASLRAARLQYEVAVHYGRLGIALPLLPMLDPPAGVPGDKK